MASIDLSEFTSIYRASRTHRVPMYAITMAAARDDVRTLQIDGRLLVHLGDCERLAAKRERAAAPTAAA